MHIEIKEGIANNILFRLQVSNIEILQQRKRIKEFIQQKDYHKIYNITNFVMKCKYCGKEYQRNKNKFSALRKNVFKQQKERSFSSGIQLLKKNRIGRGHRSSNRKC